MHVLTFVYIFYFITTLCPSLAPSTFSASWPVWATISAHLAVGFLRDLANRDPWQEIRVWEENELRIFFFPLAPFLQSHLAGYISLPEGHGFQGSLPYWLSPYLFRYRDDNSSADSNLMLLCCSSWFPYIWPILLEVHRKLHRKSPQVILISVCHLFLCQDPEWYKS